MTTNSQTPIESEETSTAHEYADILEFLTQHGYDAGIADTGGGCESIEVALEDDSRLLINDKDELLGWERADHHGWGVGLYNENDEMVDYKDTDDGSAQGLMNVLEKILHTTGK